jgi:CubicO group peptidase (beta-lactamase class C family)
MSLRSIHALKVGAALSLAVLPLLSTSAGQASAPEQSSHASSDPALAGLDDFIDGAMATHIANREVAGAAIAVVAGGRILFAKGYGYADVERAIPVQAETTLFRPGSVSKLVTWTALMQQVEQGRVKLDADVNRYLDFRIPDTMKRPIRVRDLLSHSPGFEDQEGISAATPADLVPLGQWLRTNIPRRVREPGEEIAYSNYGTALAGYIVERVSGEPFADYVDRHIFVPLGMSSSTFREPLPPDWERRMARGYKLEDGRFAARPFELYGNVMPAGSMTATATDMARFAIAHLQDGGYGGARILKPATARAMRERTFANSPSLPGFAHGFMEVRTAGPRLLAHGGNTDDFHSFLLLAPERNIGLFVSMTGGDGSYEARTELVDAIVGRLFPQVRAPAWNGPAGKFEQGSYRSNRRVYSAPADPANDVKVRRSGERGLVTEAGGKTVHWEQVGSRRYRRVTGARPAGPFDLLEFSGQGAETRLSFASQPHVLYRLVQR